MEIVSVELNEETEAKRNKKIFKKEMKVKRKLEDDESRRLSVEDPLFKSMALALGGDSDEGCNLDSI